MTDGASETPRRTPVPAVGVVCVRGREVLLIRRGQPPRKDEWSLPGGRIEWGERTADAALRELHEETGVQAELVGLIEVVDGLFASRGGGDIWAHYVLVDYAARWTGLEPRAGDDVTEARFFAPQELPALGLWDAAHRAIAAARSALG